MAKIYRISGRVLGAAVSCFHLAYLASYEVIFQGVSLSTIVYFDLINPFFGIYFGHRNETRYLTNSSRAPPVILPLVPHLNPSATPNFVAPLLVNQMFHLIFVTPQFRWEILKSCVSCASL